MQDAKGTPFLFVNQRLPAQLPGQNSAHCRRTRPLSKILAAQAEIQRLAFSDFNRPAQSSLLLERLTLRIALAAKKSAARPDYFNIDGFAAINDSLGMSAGDAVLRALAQRLGESLEQADTLAPRRSRHLCGALCQPKTIWRKPRCKLQRRLKLC